MKQKVNMKYYGDVSVISS